ncbi:hypothetical protein [Lysobacter gummosus]|uniref:hypothetical protein n=1 Tax=Lysobacter gummosus TaxID=262324 RepID=UPI00363887CD
MTSGSITARAMNTATLPSAAFPTFLRTRTTLLFTTMLRSWFPITRPGFRRRCSIRPRRLSPTKMSSISSRTTRSSRTNWAP